MKIKSDGVRVRKERVMGYPSSQVGGQPPDPRSIFAKMNG